MNPDSGAKGAAAALTPVVRRITRARTSDHVYDELVSAIRDLRLPPGASLSETELAERLHVSRTPLREAIARMVENGLVSVIPQVGTRVELISMNEVAQAQFVRESLEVAAFAVACKLETRNVAGLRALISEQERAHAASDIDAFFAADEALHEMIFAISGYAGAWRAMQPMKMQLDRLRRLSLPDPSTVADLIAEHIAIVDALEAGDARAGKRGVSKHARRVLVYSPAMLSRHPGYFTA
jgi:GntR family transcriptional regulator, rspAB operon transcriptional repressor